MNNIDYYNFDNFIEANEKFEEYISKCEVKIKEMPQSSEFTISTITSIGEVAKDVCFKYIFERIELDNKLKYVEYGKNKIRGLKENIKLNKNKKEENNDKRKLNKGKQFSNLTFGIECNNKEHSHKKPINVKLFNNGKIHITGSKTINEIITNYEYIYKKIKEINTNLVFNDKNYKINIGEFIKPQDFEYEIVMINGTYKMNFEIDLDVLYELLNEKYSSQVFIQYEKSPLKCYMKDEGDLDNMPLFFIYNSGSININAKSYDKAFNSYNFIKKILEDNYKDIVKKELIFY